MSLRVVIAGAGMVLLGLEIAGGQLLAAQFGASVYVWAGVISVFMMALSLGYFAGGAAADRWPTRGALAGLFVAAAAWIFVLRYHEAALQAIASRISDPRTGPLVAGAAMFMVPSALLAAAGPFALRLSVSDLGRLGSAVGSVNALSSVGGIAGTMLAAFVLVPTLQDDRTIQVLAGSSAALALVLAPGAAVRRLALTFGLIATMLVAPAVRAPAAYDLLYERQSLYHRIRVVARGPARYLVFDRSFQGGMYVRDPYASPFAYTDYVHLAWVFQPAIRRVLVIGLGAGAIPKRLRRDYPRLTVDVVELDRTVRDVAVRFFAVKEDAGLRITIQDGRQYLLNIRTTYDVIVLDAYEANGIPFHLATREFFELVGAHLAPGGVVVANIVGALDGQGSLVLRALYNTYRRVFSAVYLFPVGFQPGRDRWRVRTNILIATRGRPVPREEIIRRAGALSAAGVVRIPSLSGLAADCYAGPLDLAAVPVLTDNYAPVDVLPIVGWDPEQRTE